MFADRPAKVCGAHFGKPRTKTNMANYDYKFGDQLWLWFKAIPP